jgi:hypothetical protein
MFLNRFICGGALLVATAFTVACRDAGIDGDERDCQMICDNIWRPCAGLGDGEARDNNAGIISECTGACIESLDEMHENCSLVAENALDCVATYDDCVAVYTECEMLLNEYDGMCIGIDLY